MKPNYNTENYTKVDLNNKLAEEVIILSMCSAAQEIKKSLEEGEQPKRAVFFLGAMLLGFSLSKQFGIEVPEKEKILKACRLTAISVGVPPELFDDSLIS